MKRFFCFVIILVVFFSSPVFTNRAYVYAENQTNIEMEQELSSNIENQLNSLDTADLDTIFKEVIKDSGNLNNTTFSQKLRDIISGKLTIDATSFFGYISGLFIDDVLAFLPYVCVIIAISILYSMVNASHSGKNKTINDVIHFVCYGAVVVIVVAWVSKLLALTTSTLTGIKHQMDLIFPLLLTVLTALGGNVTVNVYQPAMAILSGSVVTVFTNVLLPLFTFMLVFLIISNLTTNIKFNKFADFFGSGFKWIMGIVLMLFSAFVSIQGLMAGSIDTISLKTAKYTIKSAVPLIGGFLSDGVSLIMVSSVLIKNAIGVGGLLLLFGTILLPLIKIIVFSFLLKFACAVLEPIADTRITGFISGIAKSIQMLVALILGVGFMYFLMTGLVMCSANIF